MSLGFGFLGRPRPPEKAGTEPWQCLRFRYKILSSPGIFGGENGIGGLQQWRQSTYSRASPVRNKPSISEKVPQRLRVSHRIPAFTSAGVGKGESGGGGCWWAALARSGRTIGASALGVLPAYA